jgi:hypothetical protein
MTPSATPAQFETRVERDIEEVDQLIARVLRRAHLEANALDDPDEARAVLDVAQSFADELAIANPGFDRLRFIQDATHDPSSPHRLDPAQGRR